MPELSPETMAELRLQRIEDSLRDLRNETVAADRISREREDRLTVAFQEREQRVRDDLGGRIDRLQKQSDDRDQLQKEENTKRDARMAKLVGAVTGLLLIVTGGILTAAATGLIK